MYGSGHTRVMYGSGHTRVMYCNTIMCAPALSIILQSQTPPLLEGQPLEASGNPVIGSQASLDGLEIGGESTVVEVRAGRDLCLTLHIHTPLYYSGTCL